MINDSRSRLKTVETTAFALLSDNKILFGFQHAASRASLHGRNLIIISSTFGRSHIRILIIEEIIYVTPAFHSIGVPILCTTTNSLWCGIKSHENVGRFGKRRESDGLFFWARNY